MTNNTPLHAIRLKCLDCCCGQVKEVDLCPAASCDLWPWRFGCGPASAAKRKKIVTRKAAITAGWDIELIAAESESVRAKTAPPPRKVQQSAIRASGRSKRVKTGLF
jgi:hypothetical protein